MIILTTSWYYVMWNKSERERRISRGFTYMCSFFKNKNKNKNEWTNKTKADSWNKEQTEGSGVGGWVKKMKENIVDDSDHFAQWQMVTRFGVMSTLYDI